MAMHLYNKKQDYFFAVTRLAKPTMANKILLNHAAAIGDMVPLYPSAWVKVIIT